MALGLRKNILDFSIIETNVKTIVFLDESVYMNTPEKPFLEIVLPGYTKSIRVPIIPNRVNIFNSNSFSNTNDEPVDLVDGIYQLRYCIYPHTYVFKDKMYMRTLGLENKYNKLLLSLNLSDCFSKEIKNNKSIIDFNILLQASKANAEDGNINKAIELYKKAENILETNKCK
jgi:hypothetical protein